MKKILTSVLALAVSAASLFAYNPPYNGEEIYRLANPELLSGSASSAAGGPAYNVIPSSILFNPALPASSERVTVDLSGSLFVNCDKKDGDKSAGSAFEFGILVPTSIATFSVSTTGFFSEMYALDLGKIIDVHAGVSKDVNDWLSLGANAYFAFHFANDKDFAIGGDIGALAKLGDLGPLKDARLGISVLNMGRPADDLRIGCKNSESSKFPSIFTPRAGFAAGVFEAGNWKGSFSADIMFPTLIKNFITDVGFEFDYGENLRLNIGWNFNVCEAFDGKADYSNSCSVGVSYKFGFKSSKMESKNKNWGQNDITPSVAMQDLPGKLFAVSGGVRVDLGQKDTTATQFEEW